MTNPELVADLNGLLEQATLIRNKLATHPKRHDEKPLMGADVGLMVIQNVLESSLAYLAELTAPRQYFPGDDPDEQCGCAGCVELRRQMGTNTDTIELDVENAMTQLVVGFV